MKIHRASRIRTQREVSIRILFPIVYRCELVWCAGGHDRRVPDRKTTRHIRRSSFGGFSMQFCRAPGFLHLLLQIFIAASLFGVVRGAPVAAQQVRTAAPAKAGAQADPLAAARAGFATPPMDARPMVRWWWFGPTVDKAGLARDLRTMKEGGFGGAEIQPVYPLELDDASKGFHNMQFLSKEFLDMVGSAAQTSHDLNMRLNMTLGSGWPYGGSYVPVSDAAARLRIVADAIPADASSVAVPAVENGEKLLAAFVTQGTPKSYDAEHAV